MADDQSYLEDDRYAPTGFGDIGLYMRNKRMKTQFQHQEYRKLNEDQSMPQILRGTSLHINGQTNTSIAHLQDLILRHGGTLLPVLDRKAQIAKNGFIIASHLPPSKRKEFKDYKVVTEDWILQSCHQQKLLDWRDYKLSSNAGESDAHGQFPGGMPVAQQNLLNFRKPPSPSKRPIGTDDIANDSPYLPSKRSHRAGELVADDVWRRQHTAVAPDFIENYFKQSRLHHLSAWKAELPIMVKRLCDELVQEGKLDKNHRLLEGAKQPALTGTIKDRRTIFHVDFDCFFSSAGLISRPSLKGKPIAVCHGGGHDGDGSTSEIASCSYEARNFGVRNGMSLGKARELCPDIQVMPYDFDLYARISSTFYKILLSHADRLQPISVDECYIDVSAQLPSIAEDQFASHEAAIKLAERIRDDVRSATSCEVSIGISHNMVLARIATKRAKPASSFQLLPDEVDAHLAPLEVDELPGVGWSQTEKLAQQLEIKTVGQLKAAGRGKLQACLGENLGIKLLNFACGVDARPVEPPGPRKSVSVELNYAIRFATDGEVQEFLGRLSQELVNRMDVISVAGKQLMLKVMRRSADADLDPPKFLGHGRCDIFSASHSFSSFTVDARGIAQVAIALLKQMHIPPEELRGIALNMQKLNNAAVLDRGQQRLQFALSKPIETPKPVASTSRITIEDPVIVVTSSPPVATATGGAGSSIIIVEDQKKDPAKKRSRSPSAGTAKRPRQPILMPLRTKRDHGKSKTADLQTKIGRGGALSFDLPKRIMPDHRKITDEDLLELGVDPTYFRAIPTTDRMDVLSTVFQAKKQEEAELAKQRATLAARNLRLKESSSLVAEEDWHAKLNTPILPEPAFRRLRDMDDIRAKLLAWVAAARQGPAAQDTSKLEKFLLASLEHPEGGHSANLERVAMTLKWLRWVVQDLDDERNRKSWMSVYDRLRSTVTEAVIKLRGRPLFLDD